MRTLILAALAATFTFPQTIVDQTFVMRFESTNFDSFSGMTHVCALVFPDGKYRLEKSYQPNTGGALDMRIYLDQMPEASLKELRAALEDPDFRAIHTPEPHGGVIPDLDPVAVTVPREREFQNINFDTAAQRRPYEKSLRPLLNWMRDLQKRKVPVAKDARSDNCRPPQVMYRRPFVGRPDDTDDSDKR
jgi:hypothetical protein